MNGALTTIQLAKVLQLAGVLLASVFGGILLDEAIGGKAAKRFGSLVVGSIGRLSKFTQELEKRVRMTDERMGVSAWMVIWGLCFLWVAAITTLIIGTVDHISVLLWVGVGLYSLLATGFVVIWPVVVFVSLHVPRVRPLAKPFIGTIDKRRFSRKAYLREYALVTPVSASGLIWPVVLIVFSLSFFLKVSGSAMKTLAGPRVPKAAFVVMGYLVLLTGIVLDIVAAF